ncbi:hypothetical protein ACS5PU_16865 [Pedobacter sp. GSP4]|uniref:hypothetical protein n=1 Tax=Pedobacter sp. GSP4 TaxID=3453716 RepID=UPI003EEA90EA
MTAFDIRISHNGEPTILSIIPKDDYFIITHHGQIIGATRREGLDWILMERTEIEEWQLAAYEQHAIGNSKHLVLGAAEINLIAGEIENHLK